MVTTTRYLYFTQSFCWGCIKLRPNKMKKMVKKPYWLMSRAALIVVFCKIRDKKFTIEENNCCQGRLKLGIRSARAV